VKIAPGGPTTTTTTRPHLASPAPSHPPTWPRDPTPAEARDDDQRQDDDGQETSFADGSMSAEEHAAAQVAVATSSSQEGYR